MKAPDLDYVCPFSAKMWLTLHSSVFPTLYKKYPSKVRFILRQQIQPWHPSSTLAHEAAAAVLRIAPDKFVGFSTRLFEHQKEYFDVNVVHETRNQTYRRLSDLAARAGVDEGEVYDLLQVSDRPDKDGALNGGNRVTDDIKQMVKANRLTGVHVTPTVLFNVSCTIVAKSVELIWEEWLQKNVV
ncbi:MAG: hypothetical protein LQ340_001426 [Diploschistes diacapsis]|nr:MAG: hypothetical protein LQ340_001426 [Diploschistes diacapsis]